MSLANPKHVEDLLNFRLSRLLENSGAMITRLCEGGFGITRREWRLLALLAAHGSMSPSELAALAHLERGRVSRLVTELQAKGLVRRQRVAHDGRRATLILAAKGSAVYEQVFPQSVRFSAQVLSVLTAAEQQAFDQALRKLTETAERIAAARPVPHKADRRRGGARKVDRLAGA